MKSTVLVTGGASRIGRSICLSFAALGYDIVVHTRGRQTEADETAVECCTRRAPKARAHVQPLGTTSDARALISAVGKRCAEHGATLAGVVVSGGMFVPDTIDRGSGALLVEHGMANFLLPVAMLREFTAHHHAKATSGWFTFISDQTLWNPNADFFSYTVSKGMLPGALSNLAVAAAPHVRCNAVVPGLTLPSGDQTQENLDRVHDNTPLKRGTDNPDVAAACHYLAGARATTGQCLFVDAGQRFMRCPRDVMYT